MASDGHPSPQRRRPPVWALAFLAFFLLSAAWAVGSPMATSPDEPAHIVKAAATARLEFTADSVRHEVHGGFVKDWLGFKLPAKYNTVDAMSLCFRGVPVGDQPWKSAACGKPFGTDGTTAIVETSAGQYNPLYYLPVGLPSLFLPGKWALYGMRAVSALLSSGLLAAAVAFAFQWRSRGWPVVGVLACATPMVLFLNGTVNPNGMEASAAVLAWVVGLSLVLDHQPALVRVRVLGLAVAAIALANTRSLGILWLAAVLGSCLVVADRGVLKALARNRAVWIAGGCVLAGVVLAEWWNLYAASITKPVEAFPYLTPGPAASAAFAMSGGYIDGMIGDLGWLDVPLPPGTTLTWFAVLGVVAVIALACGGWRDRTVVIGLIAGTVAIPVVAQIAEAKTFGIAWQGRYGLAWAVGVPLAGGLIVARRVGRDLPAVLERRVPPTGAALLAVAGAAAFYWSFLRYGQGGYRQYLPTAIVWNPPGGWLLTWLVYLAGAAALVAVTVTSGSARREGVVGR